MKKDKLEQLISKGFVKFKSIHHIDFYEKGREIIFYNTKTKRVVFEYYVGKV